jgi:ribosome-associated protein
MMQLFRSDMEAKQLEQLVVSALEDLKGNNIVSLDVGKLTDVMDYLVIASGSSNRHVKALSDNVTETAKQQGIRALGVEGQNGAEWILVDFGDVVVHIMLPATRDFYDLERLWSAPPAPAAGTPAAGSPAAGSPAAGSPAAGSPAAGTPAAGSPAADD